jgi:pimeloyl-ACP methyl ester carboxylesterase
VVAPDARGCAPTTFHDPLTARDGTSAARFSDFIALMDGLNFASAVVVGQDMGAQTAQAAAILAPERVERLAILNGHGLFNLAVAQHGATPSFKTFHAGWYQWLFQLPLGGSLLRSDPRSFARYLWSIWSPGWNFSDSEFDIAAASFDGPDWVATMLSAYRGAPKNADPSDTRHQGKLMTYPAIDVPSLNLQGELDAVDIFADTQLGQESFYRGGFERIVIPRCGHFLHRERPTAGSDAIIDFLR